MFAVVSAVSSKSWRRVSGISINHSCLMSSRMLGLPRQRHCEMVLTDGHFVGAISVFQLLGTKSSEHVSASKDQRGGSA
jgi:hypothetical protein